MLIFKKPMKIVIITMICVLLYLFSYSFVLPFAEHSFLKNIIYALYEPVEFLRLHSDLAYSCTEKLYQLSGGITSPKNRFYFHAQRKLISFYKRDNNRIKQVTVFRNGNANGVENIYYDNKQLASTAFYENDMLNGVVTTYFNNGQKFFSILFINDIPLDGTYTWNDFNGAILATCKIIGGMPYDGTAILYDQMPNSISQEPSDYMYFHMFWFCEKVTWNYMQFKDGKVVDKKNIKISGYHSPVLYENSGRRSDGEMMIRTK